MNINKIINSSLILTFSLGAFAQQGGNPFEVGTGTVALDPSRVQAMSAYSETSVAQLDRAIRELTVGDPRIQLPQLINAAISIVRTSSISSPGSELFLRVTLNQALELVHGVPNANGEGVSRPALFPNIPIDQRANVLRSSFTFARSLFPAQINPAVSQNTATQADSHLYIRVANSRLLIAFPWGDSVNTSSILIGSQFRLAVLQQWLNVVHDPRNLQLATVSAAWSAVQRLMREIPLLLNQHDIFNVFRRLGGAWESEIKPAINTPELTFALPAPTQNQPQQQQPQNPTSGTANTLEQFHLERAVNYPDHFVNTTEARTLEECASSCSSSSTCERFTFVQDWNVGQSCWLRRFRSDERRQSDASTAGMISGTLRSFSSSNLDLFNIESGFNYSGNDIGSAAVSDANTIDSCAQACTRNSRCGRFSFVSNWSEGARCWIKTINQSQNQRPEEAPSVISGTRRGLQQARGRTRRTTATRR